MFIQVLQLGMGATSSKVRPSVGMSNRATGEHHVSDHLFAYRRQSGLSSTNNRRSGTRVPDRFRIRAFSRPVPPARTSDFSLMAFSIFAGAAKTPTPEQGAYSLKTHAV